MAKRQESEVFDDVVLPRAVERLRHADVVIAVRDVRVARRALAVLDVAGRGTGGDAELLREGDGGEQDDEETGNVQCWMLNVK